MRAPLLLLLGLALLGLACVAAKPVIVTEFHDIGVLPKAPSHFKKATVVTEEELAKYQPAPVPARPPRMPHLLSQLGLQQPALQPFSPTPVTPDTVQPVAPVAPVAPAAPVAADAAAAPAAPAAAADAATPASADPAAAPVDPATTAPAGPVNPATLVDSPDALDLEALEAERRWAQARDDMDLVNRAQDEAADAPAEPPAAAPQPEAQPDAGLPIVASTGVGARCGSGGTCKLTTSGCAGTFQSGLCPGAANVRCCLPAAAPAPAASSSNAAKRDRFLQLIRSKLGSRYVRGGTGPSEFDCSGLVYWAAKQVGLTLPRVAHDQFSAGRAVNTVAARQPGDLIFFGKAGQRIYHVGVYVAPNQMINAPNSRSVVRQENYSYWPDRITQARRIF